MKSHIPSRTAALAIVALLAWPVLASAQSAPLDSLVKTATQWVAMSDSNQADRMWSSSGPIMQNNINKQDWAKYLVNLQGELGPLQGRDWTQVTRSVNPPSLPPGEYINVMFTARFAKAMTVEKVSLTQLGGKWVPVGYIVNKVEPPPAPQAQAPAPQLGAAQPVKR